MELLVLGSGTSHGIPMIGCECAVCLSDNPKNRRFRPSIAVRNENQTILIDTTPELRLQGLAFGLKRVDAVLFTHTHADHIFGLDDLRRFNELSGQEIPVYGDAATLADIRRIYDYIFKQTQEGGGKPRITLHEVESEFKMFGLHVQSFYVMHGNLPVLAYRFDSPSGSMAYVTDTNFIPNEAMDKLHNLDVLLLDCVRPEPHATHFGLQQALDVIAELQPKQAFLTHLSHHFEHDETNAQLPPNVALSYDGLTISF